MKNSQELQSRRKEVKKIFNSIASHYDQANRAISLGMDRNWRKKLVQWSKKPSTGDLKILDCATGTGDLALEFQKQLGPKVEIIGVDFSEEMLKEARKKTKDIQFLLADIQKLPFLDNTFDTCSIAYGLRNVEDLKKTLSEMTRVLKPGGLLMILETGKLNSKWIAPFYNLYFRQVVPSLGGIITGHKEAYQYLQRSSHYFPSEEAFLQGPLSTCKELKKGQCKRLFFGASFIYKVQKID